MYVVGASASWSGSVTVTLSGSGLPSILILIVTESDSFTVMDSCPDESMNSGGSGQGNSM